jgi:ribosomal protein L37E
MRGYDAWVTREPDWASYEAPQPRCGACGGFLSPRAARSEDWEDVERCDGQRMVVADTYTSLDKAILDIIGWEHLGQVRTTEYDPICGLPEPHAPHDYVVAGGSIEYRTCRRCGQEAREVIV